MILVFAKKYNQLIIYVLFAKLFLSQERQIKKRKSDPSGTRTQVLWLSTPLEERYLLSYTATRPRLFHFFDSLI